MIVTSKGIMVNKIFCSSIDLSRVGNLCFNCERCGLQAPVNFVFGYDIGILIPDQRKMSISVATHFFCNYKYTTSHML